MKHVCFFFLVNMFFISGFSQKRVEYIKIVDTVLLEGFVVYESTDDFFKNNGIHFVNVKELKLEYKSYNEVQRLYKSSGNEVLNPDLINSPFVFDSLEVTLKRDTVSCKEDVNEKLYKDARVIYKDGDRKVYANKVAGLFYRLKVLDRYKYIKRKKLKYDDYLAIYCYRYRERVYIITPDGE